MCLSLAWLYQLCIYLVVVCAIYAIIKLLLPYLARFGEPGSLIARIIEIVLWAVIAIIIIGIIFSLLSCLLGGAPLRVPSFR